MGMTLCHPGIGAILCTLGTDIDLWTNRTVLALERRLLAAALPGVTETVPAYASLLVRYDPLAADPLALEREILRLANSMGEETEAEPEREIRLPVRYGGEEGPDLPEVAAHAGLTERQVVELHSAQAYRVYMLGFLPGFAYLGGLPAALRMPRRATPRPSIPAGSVGIGGSQTGVYPVASPGGWQLIGRVAAPLIVPGKPLPFRPGDCVRFEPIGDERYGI